MNRVGSISVWIVAAVLVKSIFAAPPPEEPVEIGTETQFLIDDHLVDNRWAVKQKKEAVLRVLHPPVKHPGNPLIAGDGGFVSVAKDEEAGLFRMWYQTHTWEGLGADEEKTIYGIAYAESKDGLTWNRPSLGLHEWAGSMDNNIVWRGPKNTRASGPQILRVPEKDRRGFRFLLTYRTSAAGKDDSGIRVVGSQDGIHWDESSDSLIHPLHSDTLNSIVYDEVREEYVMFCRPKDRYRLFRGDMLDTGESRRISRMSHTSIWESWPTSPQAILTPDELDARENFNAFYGMPTRYHAGIYWGALWCFRFNDHIFTELAFSRDGYQFDRLPDRPKFLPLGEEGTWDDSMTFGSMDWVEVGDEWWFYYAGWDGDHGGKDRNVGIGLATTKRERLISMHGPAGGGVIVTRRLKWPGGSLFTNVNAAGGEFKVRVSDAQRKPIPGFDYPDCEGFSGDSLSHPVKWKEHSLSELTGQEFHLEFYLKNADLFTFHAGGAD